MKLLTLIRHAKSSWKQPGLKDFDRPLNQRGKRDALAMGRRLAAQGFAPDLILASPARRARRTAKRIAGEIGYPAAAIRLAPDLYASDPGRLLRTIRVFDDTLGHVAVVGHNPELTELANLLSTTPVESIPTCGVVRLAVASWTDTDDRCATLLDFDHPKLETRCAYWPLA